jgi:hypothetical protein
MTSSPDTSKKSRKYSLTLSTEVVADKSVSALALGIYVRLAWYMLGDMTEFSFEHSYLANLLGVPSADLQPAFAELIDAGYLRQKGDTLHIKVIGEGGEE